MVHFYLITFTKNIIKTTNMKKIEIGDIITIQFGNGTTSKIIYIDINKSFYFEDDYWFNYC